MVKTDMVKYYYKDLDTGVVLKRDMPDGWTETTWSYNIGKVKSIYERNGGVLV